jgi:general secretion pathway protein G
MKHTAHTSKGFTLIEVLVVAGIIAVLSVVGVTSYTSINMRSRDAKRKSDLEQVRSALEMYRTDTGSYPGSGVAFALLNGLKPTLVDGSPSYMPSIPQDPRSTSDTPTYYWYSPLGTTAPFYGYCLCAKLESELLISGSCGGALNGSDCNYYLKNP